MKVFVTGASGTLGSRLVARLSLHGHEVVGMTRKDANAEVLRRLGAEPVIADGLDREAVMKAVVRAEPEVVVHQMTSLAGAGNPRRFEQEFAATNALRTEGTDNLMAAARAAGARRVVAQSYGNWNYERTGGAVKSETDPLDPDPPRAMAPTLAAIRHLEAAVLGDDAIEGVALRYANFYGPGCHIAHDGAFAAMLRKRRLPVIGDGAGVWSHVHVDDAVGATVAAIERGEPGIYNVADDEPAPAAVWLPELASILGAPPPRHVPLWLGRLAAGEAAVSLFTRIRGASNAKARRELGWDPVYGNWRDGFRHGLDGAPARRTEGAEA